MADLHRSGEIRIAVTIEMKASMKGYHNRVMTLSGNSSVPIEYDDPEKLQVEIDPVLNVAIMLSQQLAKKQSTRLWLSLQKELVEKIEKERREHLEAHKAEELKKMRKAEREAKDNGQDEAPGVPPPEA